MGQTVDWSGRIGRTEGAEADWRFSVFDWRVVAGHGWVHAARHERGPLAERARHWAGLRSGAPGVRAVEAPGDAGRALPQDRVARGCPLPAPESDL